MLIAEKAAGSQSTDHSASIRNRLRPLLDLFKLSRYRPTPRGDLNIEEPSAHGGTISPRGGTRTGSGKPGGQGGTAGSIYSIFQKKDGETGKAVSADPFPETKWISFEDGTRELGQLEDRAARYLLDQNLLLINADFRVYTDAITRWKKSYKNLVAPEFSSPKITEVVRGWCEQSLVEAVLGVRALEKSKEWSSAQILEALSDEALTAVAVQRYHIQNVVARELGAKLGSLKAVAAAS